MESIKPTPEELKHFMAKPDSIRNVCILAHVDHGKTTLCDALLATNRLVSKRLAGTVRYLDDRPDEQERGITMKSSAVSLLNVVQNENQTNKAVLLNLIDTPGHIDFSTEVGAALRVCDGSFILVDLAEGVCVQTRECIKKAMQEKAQMCLILNKFDRLIVEMKLDIEEIFNYIIRAIESCNVVVAETYQVEYPDTQIDVEDSGVLFSPDTGNVIFASAVHGWGFTLKQLSKLFLPLVVDETIETLTQKLWNFDCYVDQKKQIKTGAIMKGKDNLFKQFCIKTIYTIYEIIVVRMDRTKIPNILQKLGIQNATKDMLHHDAKIQIKAIMQAWKPIAETILLQSLSIFNQPCTMNEEKADYLLNSKAFAEECVEKLKPYMLKASNESETLAYVSKMFCIERGHSAKIVMPVARTELAQKLADVTLEEKPQQLVVEVIALARVFTGTLKVGQTLYVLPQNYKPQDANRQADKVTVKNLYMLFGKDLMPVDVVPPGNFCGISGLEQHVIRTATLSTTMDMVPFYEPPTMEPVIRNSIEPVNPKDLPLLREGLKLLMQSDSCVQVLMQENGEMVLLTAGDVHLAKCIEDLTKKFAKIPVNVSSPMVALRETVIEVEQEEDYLTNEENHVLLESEFFKLSIVCTHLPESFVHNLKSNYSILKKIEDNQRKSLIDIVNLFTGDIKEAADESSYITGIKNGLKTVNCEQIWSVGRNAQCINVLLNKVPDFKHNIFQTNATDKRLFFDHWIVNAFNAVCKAGPICEEPLMNVSFLVHKFQLLGDVKPEFITPQFASNIEAQVRQVMRKALEKRERRLMEPIFTTDIQVNTNILGKVYSVVGKRNGRVLDAVGMDEEEKVYLVKAQIPVIESIGLASEIRTATSGQANPNLKFSHYEIIDGDPYYEPVEEDEEDDLVNVEAALRASKIRKDLRTRKGLYVEDQVVIHAEKQRTLNKKK